MRTLLKPAALALLTMFAPGCFRHGGNLLGAVIGSTIISAAILSSREPPPAYVVEDPPPRSGYSWQRGYWALDGDDWVWVRGHWVPRYPGYEWEPAQWVRDPSGQWRLMPGRWVAQEPPLPPN